jgi:2-dehydro-3-deoxyphosphogluconate aldolase / (4S)-4-hydroxy-2-oxoglutarate aldolase
MSAGTERGGAALRKKDQVLRILAEHGLLPLYFHDDLQRSIDILESLYRAGIRAVEYADRGGTALRNFEKLRSVCENRFPGCHLGIGTIKDGATAHAYREAGADFFVSPGLVDSVADELSGTDLLWIPGCLTPTEIIRAEAWGAELVKLYPLNTLGPVYLEALRPVFPTLGFMPTGGIALDDPSVSEWIRAGATALGGSRLITESIVAERDWDRLSRDTRRVLELIRSVRARRPRGSATARRESPAG